MPPDLFDLKAQVWAELKAGDDINEAYLQDEAKRQRIYGLTESNHRIYINTAPHVMDTLIHEILHRLKPRWGERRVLKTASRIIATMDDREVRRWHRQYQRVVKRTETIKVD